jgi:hypothetical protein
LPVAVVFTDSVLRRFLFGVVLVMTTVVLGVAAAAFYTSFEAIRAFAERSGGIKPEHAWLAPLLVDSFIFVASAADLWCSATGTARTAEAVWQRAVTWLPKALLGLAAGGSFALNVAHAPTHIGARVVAALAPAALVLTFEILMMIVRRAVAARVARLSATTITTTSERSTTLTRPDHHTPTRPGSTRTAAMSGGRRNQTADARLADVRRLYLDGVTVAEAIARRLGIPPSTTRRLLSQVKRELAANPTANGGDERPTGERSPRPERAGQPTERAMVALGPEGMSRR